MNVSLSTNSPDPANTLEQANAPAIVAQELVATLKQQIAEVEAMRVAAAELASSLQSKLIEANTAAATALAASTTATNEKAVVETNSQHVQAAKEYIDGVRAELDRKLTGATQSATDAEGHKGRAQAAEDSATELLSQIQAQKKSAEADAQQIGKLHLSAKESAETAKRLADRSDAIDKRLSEYESALAELRAKSEAQLTNINGLLPGATAAGLAHAFDDRRKTFLSPATKWQWIFVGSIALLVFLAFSGLYNVYKEGALLGWDDLARLWIARLPIAASLIWLALHASRESALAKRLEEDYGYKAAIAASFLGFQRQMAEIGKDASEGSPLSQLCQDTLATIGSPPGRIYERHRLTTTPAGELAEAAAKATKAVVPGGPVS